MISMKHLRLAVVLLPALCGTTFVQAQKKLFPESPGLVSFTYRTQFAKDMPGTLDMVKKNGITDMEFSNLFGKPAEEIRKMIDERGIKCSSYGVSYDDLTKKTAVVGRVAKILGADYVRVANIPHKKGNFTLEEAQKAVADFNQYGKMLKDDFGVGFIYHNHGFEFEKYEDGTLYDYIVKNTDKKYVNFELDILWAFFPGQDPAALINKYGKRYKALHLKDIRKGVPGNNSGGTDQNNDVVLGTGQIDIKSVIIAAKKAGIKHYYIEDESNQSVAQVPQSIEYLHSLTKD